MAQERMAPDAIVGSLTNLSGTVSAVQDDPDSPDGNWLTAPGSNNATMAHVSFGTPTGALDDSAGAQEFRVLVRKTNHSSDPTAVVLLYVNGSSTATVVSSTTISSTTGVVLAGTWTSSGITPAQVECRVEGTTGSGPPGNRASVEVGAIEWNAAIADAVTVNSGQAAVTTTANQSQGGVGARARSIG